MCHAGPGSQPSTVVVSGFSVNQTITFPAGATSVTVSFFLTNDGIGLEDDESYQLRLLNPSLSSVTIGGGGIANVIISDDEGNSVFWYTLGNCLHKTRCLLPF